MRGLCSKAAAPTPTGAIGRARGKALGAITERSCNCKQEQVCDLMFSTINDETVCRSCYDAERAFTRKESENRRAYANLQRFDEGSEARVKDRQAAQLVYIKRIRRLGAGVGRQEAHEYFDDAKEAAFQQAEEDFLSAAVEGVGAVFSPQRPASQQRVSPTAPTQDPARTSAVTRGDHASIVVAASEVAEEAAAVEAAAPAIVATSERVVNPRPPPKPNLHQPAPPPAGAAGGDAWLGRVIIGGITVVLGGIATAFAIPALIARGGVVGGNVVGGNQQLGEASALQLNLAQMFAGLLPDAQSVKYFGITIVAVVLIIAAAVVAIAFGVLRVAAVACNRFFDARDGETTLADVVMYVGGFARRFIG